MIDRAHDLPLAQQARLLDLSRSSLYYRKRPVSEHDVILMNLIDRLHTEWPFAGARMLCDMLRADGHDVGRRHMTTLMRLMGIEALYRKKKTSSRNPEHLIYPYLLRGLTIEEPNHVWATDITYIPMSRGFLYLCAVLDWATRNILSWRLSNTLTTDFCLDAVEEALSKYDKPKIFNTDQGVQFTDSDFVKLIKGNGILISMDGKGSWRDNVFVERLWRSIKYEEVYLHAYESASEAHASLARYITFYNERRPHQALDGLTPNAVYFRSQPLESAA
jgi:putative transposase